MKLLTLLRSRCPRCLRGAIFPPTWLGWVGAINERCPDCGLVFLREAGYFLGAMYVSYGLGVLTILPVGILLAVVLEWDLAIVIPIVIVQAIVNMPVYLRYSRVIWLYVDQAIDPR